MSKNKPGFDNVNGFRVGQGVNDLIQGYNQGTAQNGTPDWSRTSAYCGPAGGCHTGSNTPTLGRGGAPFGKPPTTNY